MSMIQDGRLSFAEWIEKALVEGREAEVLPVVRGLTLPSWEKHRPLIEIWMTMALQAGGHDKRVIAFMVGIPDDRRGPFREIWARLRPRPKKNAVDA